MDHFLGPEIMAQVKSTLEKLRFGILVLAFVMASSPGTEADETKQVVRVEEDWCYEVLVPKPQEDLPWCVTKFEIGGKKGIHFCLDINCANEPDFSPGGYQLRITKKDKELVHKRSLKGRRLQTPGETLTWTTVIQKSENGFFFGLLNGKSKTWGKFGGATSFAFLSFDDADIPGLNDYSHESSIEAAQLSKSKKPIATLQLRRVRVFYDGEPEPQEFELDADIIAK